MSKRLSFVQPLIEDGNLTPPLGVLTMAAIMEKEGWEVSFHDERIDDDIIGFLTTFHPTIVGISAVTASVLRGLELAKQIKRALPEAIIVFGGPHPTAMPEEVASWDPVDLVVVGEGEYTIKELCDWIISGRSYSVLKSIPNLCFEVDGKFIRNERRDYLTAEELDSLPIPAFHLMDIEKVFKRSKHGIFQKGKRILPVMASRGCPSSCTYCCRIMGRKIRYRTPELLVEEIEEMVRRFGVDEIWFEDDNFTADPVKANAILDLLIERKLGISIKFANGVRADGVNSELLGKMKKAGCYAISFGIESGSPNVLKLMRKNLSLEKATENIAIAKSMGFLVGSNCIVGYPGETADDIKESLDYFSSLDLDSMAIVNLIPFPATEVRKICESKGYLTALAETWENYIFDIKNPRVLIETEQLASAELLRLINEAYRKMYLKYLNPFRILKIMNFVSLDNLFKGALFVLLRPFSSKAGIYGK